MGTSAKWATTPAPAFRHCSARRCLKRRRARISSRASEECWKMDGAAFEPPLFYCSSVARRKFLKAKGGLTAPERGAVKVARPMALAEMGENGRRGDSAASFVGNNPRAGWVGWFACGTSVGGNIFRFRKSTRRMDGQFGNSRSRKRTARFRNPYSRGNGRNKESVIKMAKARLSPRRQIFAAGRGRIDDAARRQGGLDGR
jgi:hypothetical protein